MKNSAAIQVKSGNSEVSFEWLDYDGDDCFNDFHADIVDCGELRRFDFGPCTVSGLRKFTGFFDGKL